MCCLIPLGGQLVTIYNVSFSACFAFLQFISLFNQIISPLSVSECSKSTHSNSIFFFSPSLKSSLIVLVKETDSWFHRSPESQLQCYLQLPPIYGTFEQNSTRKCLTIGSGMSCHSIKASAHNLPIFMSLFVIYKLAATFVQLELYFSCTSQWLGCPAAMELTAQQHEH